MSEWCVYILKCVDESLYTGITNDISRRIKMHENGVGAKYTKGRDPFILAYLEPCENRSAASKREYTIKKLSRSEKEALIAAKHKF